ncbi:hypothetical protein Tco_1215845 [Tanacetum coccineum]
MHVKCGKAIERLKQGESINVQDLETNLYWEFGKFTSQDGESLESYYSRFYKMMNELVRNQCHVTNQKFPKSECPCFLLSSTPTRMQKVQNNNDNYNVFAMENEHPEQPESSNDIYLAEQGDSNITIDSSDICYDRAQDDQDETDNLDQERDLLASLIQKLKCEIDDSKNRNKFLESSNKELVDKLKGEIEDFKTKNKSLESSNNHFKEANNELSKTNQLMFKDLKKFQAELDKYNDVNYASKAKEAQIKLYKTREDKELDKVIALENKVKFLKKAQRANPRLYDIGCYNDNLALMLAPDSDETIRLDKERRSKLSDLIRPFDYDKLNNLYDLFVP